MYSDKMLIFAKILKILVIFNKITMKNDDNRLIYGLHASDDFK